MRWRKKYNEHDVDEAKVFSVNNDRRRFALVFVKLVSLTQTFDSLGTINASRHVASRKEQARGARRQECGSPMAKHAENGRERKRTLERTV